MSACAQGLMRCVPGLQALLLTALFVLSTAAGFVVAEGNTGPAATVLGVPLRVTNASELQSAILSALLDAYACEEDIAVEASEVDSFVENLRRGMARQGLTAESGLKPQELAELDAMRRDMGRAVIWRWKVNKALYDEYGGRIIYQQLGPEPLDAYRRFLEERKAQGAFSIHDDALATAFWRYFTDESMHDFMEPGGVDEARAFAVPPWANDS